jgi:hypothetical protein
VTDWGGKVAAYFGGASVASGTLALVFQAALPPMRGWKEVLFVVLVITAAVSFVLLLFTGAAALWPVLNKRRRPIHPPGRVMPSEPSDSTEVTVGIDGGHGAEADVARRHAPDLVDLTRAQVVMLREAVITFDEFLVVGNVDSRFLNPGSSTVSLLRLPEIDQRLDQLAEITVATWPDVLWASQMADVIGRTKGSVRKFRRRAYGAGHNGDDGASSADRQEPGELRGLISELRDLITGRYPGLAGPQPGKKKPSVSESWP